MGWFSRQQEAEPSQYQQALDREAAQKYDDLFDIEDADEWDRASNKLKETYSRLHEEKDRNQSRRRR